MFEIKSRYKEGDYLLHSLIDPDKLCEVKVSCQIIAVSMENGNIDYRLRYSGGIVRSYYQNYVLTYMEWDTARNRKEKIKIFLNSDL
jgi:hypothetical protein